MFHYIPTRHKIVAEKRKGGKGAQPESKGTIAW